jgi:hypothetical protein
VEAISDPVSRWMGDTRVPIGTTLGQGGAFPERRADANRGGVTMYVSGGMR